MLEEKPLVGHSAPTGMQSGEKFLQSSSESLWWPMLSSLWTVGDSSQKPDSNWSSMHGLQAAQRTSGCPLLSVGLSLLQVSPLVAVSSRQLGWWLLLPDCQAGVVSTHSRLLGLRLPFATWLVSEGCSAIFKLGLGAVNLVSFRDCVVLFWVVLFPFSPSRI